MNVFPADLIYSNDDFEVGLKEIHLPFDWLKLKGPNFFIIYDVSAPLIEFSHFVIDIDKEKIFEVINEKLNEWKSGVDRIDRDSTSGRTLVTVSNKDRMLLCSEKLADYLGFSCKSHLTDYGFQTWSFDDRATYYNENVKLSPDPSSQLREETGKRYCFSNQKASVPESNIFIHADCVKHHLFGNTFSQLLKTLPNKPGSYFHYERPTFYPLYNNRFRSITIRLKDQNNRPLEFQERILLILEIRKSKHDKFIQ